LNDGEDEVGLGVINGSIPMKSDLGRRTQPLPYPVYWCTALGLILLGMAVAIYLAVAHYRVHTDVGYQSFCAISKAINCDTVSQSAYAVLAGLPVSVWGIFGYAWFLLVLRASVNLGNETRHIWSLLFILSILYCIFSIFLALVSTYYIRSFCIMCIVTYGINLWLLFHTWIVRKRFGEIPLTASFQKGVKFLLVNRRWRWSAMLPFAAALSLTLAFYPPYWKLQPSHHTAEIPSGINADGDPWMGAAHPLLEIIEFADYQCFQCRKMHFYLRQLVVRHPEKIRLIHRHYPMDDKVNPVVQEPFHVGSGALAILAIHAGLKGKFWEMNDELYELSAESESIDVAAVASRVGLNASEIGAGIRNPQVLAKLSNDIQTDLQLGIAGTPAYLVNGTLSLGTIPPDSLKVVFE